MRIYTDVGRLVRMERQQPRATNVSLDPEVWERLMAYKDRNRWTIKTAVDVLLTAGLDADNRNQSTP